MSDLGGDKHVAKLIILLLQHAGLVGVGLGQRDLLGQLHLCQSDLHVLLGIGQHDVSGVVVHAGGQHQ